MFCPKCARENPLINKFCNGCGASLKVEALPPLKAAAPVAQTVAVPPPPPKPIAEKKVNTEPPAVKIPEFIAPKLPAIPANTKTTPRTALNGNIKILIGAAGLAALCIVFSVVYFIFRGTTGSTEFAAANKAINQSKTNENAARKYPPQPPEKMVFVPGGEFMLGSDKGDDYSRPAHKVQVKPFFIDLTEVTNEDYKKFVDSTGHKTPPDWTNKSFPAGKAQFPVTGVDWDDANAYAKWAGKRLPTEAEWEFAAKGIDDRIYPWGDKWENTFANAANKNGGMREVGEAKGKSPFGLSDMSGNAWEWTSSDAEAYPKGKKFSADLVEPKIIRGGYWGSLKEDAATTYRGAWGARNENTYKNTGFRCVKDVATNQGYENKTN